MANNERHGKSRVLRFAVSSTLLLAPAASGCGADTNDRIYVNEPAPDPVPVPDEAPTSPPPTPNLAPPEPDQTEPVRQRVRVNEPARNQDETVEHEGQPAGDEPTPE